MLFVGRYPRVLYSHYRFNMWVACVGSEQSLHRPLDFLPISLCVAIRGEFAVLPFRL
jgi:hypothetical protein